MNVRLIAHVPFHRHEVPKAGIYMPDPKWWVNRAGIFERYTLASFERQTDQDFRVAVSVAQEDVDSGIAEPVMDVIRRHDICIPLVVPYQKWDFTVAPNHHAFFAKHGRGADWLIRLQIDSDDLYMRNVVEHLRHEVLLSEGLMLHWDFGWEYGLNDGKMCWFGSRTGPPPFLAECYNGSALRSAQHFGNYRKHYRFDCYHHRVTRCPNHRSMQDGMFMQLIHGRNSSQAWNNIYVTRRIVHWVENAAEKADVLSLFGIQP